MGIIKGRKIQILQLRRWSVEQILWLLHCSKSMNPKPAWFYSKYTTIILSTWLSQHFLSNFLFENLCTLYTSSSVRRQLMHFIVVHHHSYLWISRFLRRVAVMSSACVSILNTHSFRFLHYFESHCRYFESTLRYDRGWSLSNEVLLVYSKTIETKDRNNYLIGCIFLLSFKVKF